jgi:hypothetical protein
MNIDGTYDIETEDWTTFVVGGLYDGVDFLHSRDETEFFRLLLRQKGTFWAHNGGKFDVLWFYSMLKQHNIRPKQIVLQGSRVLILKVKSLTLRDSFALIPMSLDKAGGLVSDAKDKLPFDYSEIRRDMSYEKMCILIDYLQKDCTLLWDILHYARSFAAENGLVMKSTVGASAWASMIGETSVQKVQKIEWEIPEWKFARAGYFGGRAEVFRALSWAGNRYDRNSSYPAALVNTPLPVGPRNFVGKTRATKAFDRYDGLYSATVIVPDDCYYPPLPVRTPDLTGAQRLIFPVGKFQGIWTRLELRYAQQVGARIETIHSALVWQRSEKILKPWCKRLWDLRHNAKTKAEARWLKWILNSLTGKLGERADKSVVVIPTPKNPPKGCNGHKNFHPEGTPCPSLKCCQHRHVNNPSCKRWMPLDHELNLWERPIWFIPKNSMPHWAAYLTSEARISLHKKLIEAGSAGVYCDTDSVYCERGTEITDLGSDLGQWKTEGRYENWHCLAPKLYQYTDPDTGETAVKGKGFPGLNAEKFHQLAQGEKIELNPSPHTFKSGLKSVEGRVWSKRIMEKQVRLIPGVVGSRGLNTDGTTKPLTLAEFSALLRNERK